MSIHPTAIIAPGAKLHPTVEVGPYTVIGPNVEIGEKTVVGANCHIEGYTTIGSENLISPFVSIGCPPQDRKFGGEKSFVKIGSGNHFREFVTVHMAEGAGNETVIGDKNLFMAYVHIAHNCRVGSYVTCANCVTLAGHVLVGDRATLGGFTGIHQFCKIGGLVMIGGMSKIVKDVPPFIKIDGNPARVIGLNSIGLKRNGVPRESIEAIRNLFKMFFRSNLNVSQAKEKLAGMPEAGDPYVRQFAEFLGTSTRGVYKRTRETSADREAAE
ncbi:MAG TPA: acyl-ACP--UDP-N-acetylglucosamine O-acyltransferase [Candidatus Ozemobacteraceae bacterium]